VTAACTCPGEFFHTNDCPAKDPKLLAHRKPRPRKSNRKQTSPAEQPSETTHPGEGTR
jgi:hypothetical protein